MEEQTGQMDSDIDWKLDVLPGARSCDQQLKVQLGTNHSVTQGSSWISSAVQPSEL